MDKKDLKQITQAVEKAFKGHFNIIDQRFNKMDQRFNKMDQRFNKMDQRFDKLEFELQEFQTTTKDEFDHIHKKLDKTNNETVLNGDKITQLDRKVTLELAANNSRLGRLEQHCGI